MGNVSMGPLRVARSRHSLIVQCTMRTVIDSQMIVSTRCPQGALCSQQGARVGDGDAARTEGQ